MNFITDEGTETVLDTIIKIGRRMSFRISQPGGQLVGEIVSFCYQEGTFGRTASMNSCAIDRWRDQPNTSVLRKVALCLLRL